MIPTILKVRAEILKRFRWFFEKFKRPKFLSEIIWPLSLGDKAFQNSINNLRKAKSVGNGSSLPFKSRDDFNVFQSTKAKIRYDSESGISNEGFEPESSNEHIIWRPWMLPCYKIITFKCHFKTITINLPYNSFMGSFLEFIFSKFCLFCFLLDFLEARSKESIDGTADWFDNSPYFWSSKKIK